VLRILITFAPIAGLLTITPGAATALVVRNALRGGRRHAFWTNAGNSAGVLVWGCCAAGGVAAVVATSATAFDAIKVAGAVVLIVMGARSLLGRGRRGPDAAQGASPPVQVSDRQALREGLVTSLANPKLAVFFVALFPQFVPHGTPVLPATLAMVGVIVCFDLVWYSALAALVSRAKRHFIEGGWARRFERLTGAVLLGLGVRLALARR
jgi:threonine/homoserine/homoserine lactone efflux protein